MRKFAAIAGMLLIAALVSVQPSKADSFNTYQLTGNGMNVTFTLPQTLTPSSVSFGGILNFTNVAGSYGHGVYNFSTIQLGTTGWNNHTNYWASGSQTKFFELVAPGLFTWNANGTVTLNVGTFIMGDYNMFNGAPPIYTLTVVDPPGPSVADTASTPEPASLLLVGMGGLALGALKRRKALAA